MKAKHTLVIVLSALLMACAQNPLYRIAPNKTAQGALAGAVGGAVAGSLLSPGSGLPVGAAVGGVAGALIGYDQTRRNLPQNELEDTLRNHGATVITMGDNHMVSIPNDRLFYDTTPRIRWSSYSLLNLTASYLKFFNKVSIRVVGHTNCLEDPIRDLALSRTRARNVANYLWSQDIDARLIYSQGYGNLNPIASNAQQRGRDWNERIEIVFRMVRPPLV